MPKFGHTFCPLFRIPKDDIVICYQSRFDSRKWLSPFTEKVVEGLAAEGTSIAFVCPGFVSDNLETLFDVEQDLRALYENTHRHRAPLRISHA